ncbi:hypothetical protein [Pseudomonas frederiksbergensis]|uniref:hypothetical protein n=1 Tax=Pseudomonas frederiksbergensis TaxID=104087 RepID=UPI003D229D9B
MSRFKAPPPQPIPATFNHHEDQHIVHPVTGLSCWGMVEVTSQQLLQPGGAIYLRAGKHIGPHKGFGVRHIWLERGHDLIKWGYPTFADVPRFVADIIVHDTSIVCEFDSMGGDQRVIVLRGRKGSAVLAPWPDGEGGLYYSVVTAYRNRATNGKAVARVRGMVKP